MMWILVRHGIAWNRAAADCPIDTRRPLTHQGIAKMREAMCGLAGLLPSDFALATSPFLRTRQSAEIARAVFAAHLGGEEHSIPIDIVDELQPGGPFHRLVMEDPWPNRHARILFGHSPDLEGLAAALMCERVDDGWQHPTSTPSFKLKKAGALCLQRDGQHAAHRLRWMIPPKQLRALGRQAASTMT